MPNYNIRVPSMAEIQAKARSMEREIEREVRNRTNNGQRPLTKHEVEAIVRRLANRKF